MTYGTSLPQLGLLCTLKPRVVRVLLPHPSIGDLTNH